MRQEDRLDKKIKLALPEFDRRLNVEEFLDWLGQVKNNFEVLISVLQGELDEEKETR